MEGSLIRSFAVESAEVVEITEVRKDLMHCTVRMHNDSPESLSVEAICYPHLTGKVTCGDRVLVNTTARKLGLGSGGFHFIIWTPQMLAKQQLSDGHIMKLRYTPWQMRVKAVEEQCSEYHHILKDRKTVERMPVICCEVHSQLLPVVAGIRSIDTGFKIAYVMTDGGSLPLQLSKAVYNLKLNEWLHETLTAGHCFGGEHEAVNVYSALAAAAGVVGADVTVVGIGPGIVGTGTALGHTGMQQAQAANAALSLGGLPVVPLRISTGDHRRRHSGISHHSLTVLGNAVLGKVWAVIAREARDCWHLWRQIYQAEIADVHRIVMETGSEGMNLLQSQTNLQSLLSFMGRNPEQEPEFFLTAAAAGRLAAKLVQRSLGNGSSNNTN